MKNGGICRRYFLSVSLSGQRKIAKKPLQFPINRQMTAGTSPAAILNKSCFIPILRPIIPYRSERFSFHTSTSNQPAGKRQPKP